jgi:hypothetical protein
MASLTEEDAIMKSLPNLTASILCCAAALATTATLAHADIIKCVDRSGHVTLTDASCPAGNTVELQQVGGHVRTDMRTDTRTDTRGDDGEGITIDRLSASTGDGASSGTATVDSDSAGGGVLLTTQPAPAARAIEHVSLQASELPQPTRVLPLPARRSVTLDASTLQQAHETMLMMDNANRSHKLVAWRW